MERIVRVDPRCRNLRFILRGDDGATQLVVSTGWGRASGWSAIDDLLIPRDDLSLPSGTDRGFHWWATRPSWYSAEDEWAQHECDLSPTGRCWYDGSGIAGGELFRTLFEQGEEAMWASLTEDYERYHSEFVAAS